MIFKYQNDKEMGINSLLINIGVDAYQSGTDSVYIEHYIACFTSASHYHQRFFNERINCQIRGNLYMYSVIISQMRH